MLDPRSGFSAAKSSSPQRALVWRKVLVRLIFALILVLALELVFHLVLEPNMRIKRIVITGDLAPGDGEVFEWTGIRKDDYYFLIDEETLRKRLSRMARVKEARVEKLFPDTVSLFLMARKPLAVALVEVGSKTEAACFDEEGVVFALQRELKQWDLPVISGVQFAGFQLGMRFPAALSPLLKNLDALRRASPALFSLISEIQVKKSGREGHQAVIFPSTYPVRVLVGEEWNEKTLRQVFVVLDLMKKEGFQSRMKEIDFRTDHVVMREREG